MWVLILALVMLSISALLSAYITLCYRHKDRALRPMVFNRHKLLFGLINIAFFVPGTIMVFMVTGWKWGLVALLIYWMLVAFVLMPIVSKRLFSFELDRELERMDSGLEKAKQERKKDKKEIESTPEGQVRAAMAACIAMEIRAGRDPEEAKDVCYERIKNRIVRGSHPQEGK